MEPKAFLRPLLCIAKHEVSLAGTASRSKANTQRHLSTSQPCYASLPNFLLPPSVIMKNPTFAVSRRHRASTQSAPVTLGHPPQRRMFSATPAASTAVVTANPRKDEDGNDMLIDITSRAANVCSFHSLRPPHTNSTNPKSSVLEKSCPRTRTLILLCESQSSPAGVMAFNT